MNNSEWTPRIATADRYLEAQYSLMAAATDGAPVEETLCRLDDVRRARVEFNSIPPAGFQEERAFSPSEAEAAVEFLERRLKAKKNDDLLSRWLDSAEWPSGVHSFEKTHGLDLDPDHDVVIVGGQTSAALSAHLRKRGFQRIIQIDELYSAENPSEIDNQKLGTVLRNLPKILDVRPGRLHYENPDIESGVRAEHLEKIRARLELLYVSQNTTVLMAPLWTPNVLKNLSKFAISGRNILSLQGAATGATAVIIGAGPSLDEVLPKLVAVKDKALVICAFKALKAVTAAGLYPDIVVCLDPKQKIRHLAEVNLTNIGAFLLEAASDVELVATINECPLLPYVASTIPLELIRAIGAINMPIIGTGGSAIHGALQAAILLGCKKIYFAGADFGFPNNQLYASGAGTGDEFLVSPDGTSYDRRPLDSHQRGGQLYPVASNSGGTVAASTEMVQFREWVEARIHNTAQRSEPHEFYNLSFSGARIAGVRFAETIDVPANGEQQKSAVRRISKTAEKISKLSHEKVKTRFKKRIDRLRKLQNVCSKILVSIGRSEIYDHQLKNMIRHAKRCIEISTMVNAQLITLNEYTSKIKTMNPRQAEVIIQKLVKDASAACQELIQIYEKEISLG